MTGYCLFCTTARHESCIFPDCKCQCGFWKDNLENEE